MVAEAAKKSPELIQLLELHQQFATIAPYSQKGKMIEKPVSRSCKVDLIMNLICQYSTLFIWSQTSSFSSSPPL